MTKYSALEWQILNKIAEPQESKKQGYYVIMMGDDLQNSVMYGRNSFGSDNILCPTTIKLKSPIRSKNVHTNANNIFMENFTAK